MKAGRARPAIATALGVLVLVAGLVFGTRTLWDESAPLGRGVGEETPAGEPERNGLADHRDTVYEPVRDLLDGGNPYDAEEYRERTPGSQAFNPYTPSWFALATPFGVLPLGMSRVLWLGAAVVAALASVALAARAAGRRWGAAPVLAVTGVAVALGTTQHALFTGQVALLQTAAAVVAATEARRRPVLAGVAIAIAAVKPQMGLPLVVALLVGLRAWRAVGIGTAITAVASLPALVASSVAAGGLGRWVETVFDNLDRSNGLYRPDAAVPEERIDPAFLLARLTGTDPGNLGVLLDLLACAGLAWLLRRAAGRHGGEPGPAICVAVVALATAIGSIHFGYDGVLALPVVVVLATARPGPLTGRGVPRGAVVVALLAALPLVRLSAGDALLADLVAQEAVVVHDALAINLAAAVLAVLLWRVDPRSGSHDERSADGTTDDRPAVASSGTSSGVPHTSAGS